MGTTVVLAYEETDVAWAARLVALIAEGVGGAVTAPLGEAPLRCPAGGVIVALLPARGPRLERLRRAGEAKGCRVVGPLPPRLLGGYAARALRRSPSCKRGWIVYRRAEEFEEQQAIDLGRAAYYATRHSQIRVGLLPYNHSGLPSPPIPGCCAVVPSLLPGRLPRILEDLGWRVAGRYMLEDGKSLNALLLWLSRLLGRVEST